MKPAAALRSLLLLLLTLAPLSGCGYVQQRFLDGVDVGRFEPSLGIGAQAHVNVGELAHIGIGSSYRHLFGLNYGLWRSQWQVEDHLPLSYLWTLANTDLGHLHRIWSERQSRPEHRCYIGFPGELHHDELDKSPIHYLDIEVGGQALIVGGDIGFSLGEFADFLLGLFKFSDTWTWLDIADDDLPDQRQRRSILIKRDRKLGSPLQK